MDSGVYKIQNTQNFKVYIGSTYNFKDRFRRHKQALANNKHCNKHLQASYNKYGKESFIFVPLKECNLDDLLVWEQVFLDFYKPEYNICNIAGNTLGYKHTEEYLNSRREGFVVISPKGEIVEGFGIARFAKDNNLNYGHFREVIKGKRFVCQGWTANFQNYLIFKYYGSFAGYKRLNTKYFDIINKYTQEKHRVFGINKSALELELKVPNLIALRQGLIPQTKGWVLDV